MRPVDAGTDWLDAAVIVGLAGVTVLTRCFFFILDRPWTLPAWAHRALQYAPVAALAGVVVPEVVMANGASRRHLAGRAPVRGAGGRGAVFLAHAACCCTLVVGMAVYLPLHLGLGW